MLPKNRRIQKKLFSSTVLHGKRFNSNHFMAYVTEIDKSKQSLFSFSVSKKVCKSAVDRNRLRRQGYSIISKHLKEFLPGFTCFFSFKKGSSLIKFDDMQSEIGGILKTANVI